jgi:hypothetical protein
MQQHAPQAQAARLVTPFPSVPPRLSLPSKDQQTAESLLMITTLPLSCTASV